MMHKRKRALALLLALVLAALTAAPAGAASPAPSPVIFTAGFGTELYLNDGSPEEEGVLIGALGQDVILAALGAALRDAFMNPLALLCSPSPTADVLSSFLLHWLGNLACDENGDSAAPVSNTSRNTAAYDYGFDGYRYGRPFYEFHYDWRLDPMDTAKELHAYIQQVKELTGSAKVNLNALSFGSVICCAYLEQYGTEDLESLFLCVSAHGGLSLGEDLIQKKLTVNSGGIAPLLAQMLPDEDGTLGNTLRVLDCLGIFKLVGWLLNGALGCLDDRLYEKAIVPLLAQMPAAWAFVADDEAYENGKRLLLEDTEKYAALIERIDVYHYAVGNRTNDILKEAAEEIKVALVSGYGLAPIPLGGAGMYQSDFLIDTARSSGGAVCADYGKTLPEGYTQAVADGHGHLSPDGVIDASTCALPEQTWFIAGYEHQYEYGGGGVYAWFVNYDGQPTVHSSADYPQFM